MADPYAAIAEADEAVQARLADVLDLRASDPQQRAMLHDYLSAVQLRPPARALDVGCGTGSVTRQLLELPGLTEVVGIDPSPVFIERARAEPDERLSFVTGDGRELPFDGGSFDLVVCHTVLCHVPAPERVLSEAARVARGGAWLAVFDGDYPTATVANSAGDPLQSCIDATVGSFVHDAFLTRRLARLVEAAGWTVACTTSHGYVETAGAEYMLTLVDRGADVLAASGRLGETAAAALKAEARGRVERGEFFGHIAYLSVIARLASARMEELLGERVTIVPAGPENAERLRELRTDPEVARWWDPPPGDWPLAREPGLQVFAILVGGEPAGALQFWEESDAGSRHADVDILLGAGHQDRGLGTEAMRLIVRHLIEDRGHHRVTLSTAVDNARAIHVYEKVGFRPVGITRKSQLNEVSGGWQDELLMEFVV